MSTVRRPLAAVSLKAYFGHEATLRWCFEVREATRDRLEAVDLMLVPVATALSQVSKLLVGTPILLGAQDCSAWEPGPRTGELPAETLREVGAAVVELGHAERRRLMGETDAVIATKVARAVEAGLTPMLCVGEAERTEAPEAALLCLAQLDAAMTLVPSDQPVLVAYEPVWAIGADRPASASHVRAVGAALRGHIADRPGSRVLYGGTAGPGVFDTVRPDLDGLFLGRRAHDVRSLVEVIDEMARASRRLTDDSEE